MIAMMEKGQEKTMCYIDKMDPAVAGRLDAILTASDLDDDSMGDAHQLW